MATNVYVNNRFLNRMNVAVSVEPPSRAAFVEPYCVSVFEARFSSEKLDSHKFEIGTTCNLFGKGHCGSRNFAEHLLLVS